MLFDHRLLLNITLGQIHDLRLVVAPVRFLVEKVSHHGTGGLEGGNKLRDQVKNALWHFPCKLPVERVRDHVRVFAQLVKVLNHKDLFVQSHTEEVSTHFAGIRVSFKLK